MEKIYFDNTTFIWKTKLNLSNNKTIFLKESENIINANPYKQRYNCNNDCFIHIRLTDASQHLPDITFYINAINNINFEKLYIATDEINHNVIKLILQNFPNSMFIGLLSRFEDLMSEKVREKGVLIVSGPTSYYSQLFEYFNSKIKTGEIELIIGNDKAFEILKKRNKKVNFHNSKNWKDTDNLIVNAKRIFGYCGYSTLMDIESLKCESHLIACPGQLEQIYLQKKVLRNSQDFL
jgi:hypothetical protein